MQVTATIYFMNEANAVETIERTITIETDDGSKPNEEQAVGTVIGNLMRSGIGRNENGKVQFFPPTRIIRIDAAMNHVQIAGPSAIVGGR
jgi:hypothetical protein